MSTSGLSFTDPTKFVDQNPDTRYRNFPPCVIIKAAEAATNEWLEAWSGDDAQPGVEREVIYDYSSTEKYHMVLTLFKMPTGAADITLGSWSGSTFTSSVKGKLIEEDGTLSGAKPDADDIAGALLSHYCQHTGQAGSPSSTQPYWETTLEEGDYIWVVRKGRVSLLVDTGGVSSGDRIVADNTAGDGRIQPAATIGNTTAVDQASNIVENLHHYGKCIGVSKESAAAGEYSECWLDLPRRWSS